MTKKEIKLIKQRVKENDGIYKNSKIYWDRFNKYLDSLECCGGNCGSGCNQYYSYKYGPKVMESELYKELEDDEDEEGDRKSIFRLMDILEELDELGLEDVCIEDGVIKIRI